MIGLGTAENEWPWIGATVAQTLLIAVPLIPLALKWPLLRYRSIFQTWLLACAYPLFLALTRLILPTYSQLLLLVQIVLTAVFAAWLWRQRPTSERPSPASRWIAISLALLVGLPWLAWGSLGSLLDTLLALTLGLLFGVVVGLVNGRYWLHTLPQHSQGTGWDMTLGGFAMGTAVLILSSGLSFNGAQMLLILALPALAWMMMSVALVGNSSAPGGNQLAVGLLAGGVAAIILAFTDTDGLVLVAFDALLFNAMRAVLVTAVIAWLVGSILFLLRRRLAQMQGSGLGLPVFAALALILSVVVYLFAGQPGLYGDRLFVILSEQADVSEASTMANYDERRQFVYDTLTAQANSTQADLRQSLNSMGIAYTPYYLVNAIEVRGGMLHRLWLSIRPEVDRVIPSPILRPVTEVAELPSQPASAPAEPQWNLTNIGADRVWQEFGVRGAGIIVGESDSGVQWDHPELPNFAQAKLFSVDQM